MRSISLGGDRLYKIHKKSSAILNSQNEEKIDVQNDETINENTKKSVESGQIYENAHANKDDYQNTSSDDDIKIRDSSLGAMSPNKTLKPVSNPNLLEPEEEHHVDADDDDDYYDGEEDSGSYDTETSEEDIFNNFSRY